jgi:hypothetical protein
MRSIAASLDIYFVAIPLAGTQVVHAGVIGVATSCSIPVGFSQL